MDFVFAQLGPTEAAMAAAKAASDALSAAAATNNTAQLLVYMIIGIGLYAAFMTWLYIKGNIDAIKSEKEHSKKVEELVKEGSEVFVETRKMIQEFISNQNARRGGTP